MESMEENFLGHLGQLKCLAFWWWWRITQFLKFFSQQKQNGLRHDRSLCFLPISYSSIQLQPCPAHILILGMDERKRQELKVSEEKGTITLQGDNFAAQVLFSSPTLEVCNYLEQVEKYRYRAALSTVNLKVEQFDEYYSQVRERIDNHYHSFLYNSLAMFQDLVTAVKFGKIQMWHQQAMLAEGLRNNLYLKHLDPYDFNPSQFQQTKKEVIQLLNAPKDKVEQSRKRIDELTVKLKDVEGEHMEDMFSGKVTNPYVAQNKDKIQINPSGIFSSYMIYLKVKMERSDQALFRKFYTIHEDVIKFGQFIFQHSLKIQANAASIIRRYSQMTNKDHQSTHIVPVPHIEARKQQVDADQLSTGKQVRSESKPALINKQSKVEFKSFNRVSNMDTSSGQIIQVCQNEERGKFDATQGQGELAPKESPFASFTERRRINYRQFQQNYWFDKKMKDDDLRFGYRQMRERQREKERVIVRRVIRTSVMPAPWSQFAQHKSPYLYFLESRTQKEKTIWQIKGRGDEYNLTTYTGQKVKNQPKDEKEKEDIEQIQNKRALQDHMFEKRRAKEEETRLAGIAHLIASRTYQNFLALSKMENFPQDSGKQFVKRYGMKIKIPLELNYPTDIDKFFYYYFKERYYREHAEVKQNADNPIIFLDFKKVSMGGSRKVVGQLIGSVVKRMQNMPFFFLWSRDLIMYKQTKMQGVATAEFDCYSFGQDGNCEKLMYQIRRRTGMEMKESINRDNQKEDEDEQIFSKIQIAHRLLYNRHRTPPSVAKSVEKGQAIALELLSKMQYQ